jgi:hypothetical protein
MLLQAALWRCRTDPAVTGSASNMVLCTYLYCTAGGGTIEFPEFEKLHLWLTGINNAFKQHDADRGGASCAAVATCRTACICLRMLPALLAATLAG